MFKENPSVLTRICRWLTKDHASILEKPVQLTKTKKTEEEIPLNFDDLKTYLIHKYVAHEK